MKKWIKCLGLFAAAAIGFVLVLYVWGAMLRPKLLAEPADYPAAKIQKINKLRDVNFDPKNPPVVQRDVNYAEGKAAPWYPISEAPILADLVKAKKLPLVAERVGPEPLVLEGPDGIGKYGGTWYRVANAMGDVSVITWRLSGTTLVRWSPMGYPIKPHTWGDYVLTFMGFIGICVPNFLLGILLMYWSGKYLGVNVTGLFSPEYAAQPEWTWGKVVDLLQHVWVPIIVIATAGTAGMIRVMRGNLLDEVRKPYVTTAMAKGVRPFRLLMKYPVRLALNPFISGIGGIFPQLVSGGAIVAIVLSLPMVGPLMLTGLQTQDIYLAGSMLMVLSLLGIFGTLVSDLLLLWLDPRIRLEGGSR